jgi:hypothetical protein
VSSQAQAGVATDPDAAGTGAGSNETASLRRYEAIHEHAELELEAAGGGDLERLVALGERWEELTQGLPPRPPAAAAQLLRAARMIHERTRVELIRLREGLLVDISTSTRARRTAEGYAGQVAHRRRLDHSA